jgi:hypothetical protein
MLERQPINDSYYCSRLRQTSVVSILTGNAYVVAEYDQRTGEIRWHRVVNASQKENICKWLRDHFPLLREERPKAQASAPAGRKARSAAA